MPVQPLCAIAKTLNQDSISDEKRLVFPAPHDF